MKREAGHWLLAAGQKRIALSFPLPLWGELGCLAKTLNVSSRRANAIARIAMAGVGKGCRLRRVRERGLSWIVLAVSFFVNASLFAAAPPATQRNFVACPIVRDTETVPCWLAVYDGELYYLGIQSDVNADWTPPYLGHRVLVEGTVTNDGRVCGGMVLKPVVTSALPEADSACNSTVLPAEERYTVPYAPRGPGPAKTSATRTAPTQPNPPFAEKTFVVPYDFDWPSVSGKSSRVVQQAVNYARAGKAARIEIVGHRAATLLSNGELLVEKNGIAERRAKQASELLVAVGIDAAILDTKWQEQPEQANGVRDFEHRQVTITVKP